VEAGKIGDAKIKVLLLQRKYSEALRVAEELPEDKLSEIPGYRTGKFHAIGFLRKKLADEAGARLALLRARELAEAHLKAAPEDPGRHARLAPILALLGEKEAAMSEAQRAMDLLPESKDAFNGPDMTAMAAEVYAHVGE
jgi:tetratricopeptide (TPR) repeat protein